MKTSKKKTKGVDPVYLQKVFAPEPEPAYLGNSSSKIKKLIARFPAPKQFAEQEPTASWVLPHYYDWCSEGNLFEWNENGSDEACLLANILGQALAAVRATVSNPASNSKVGFFGEHELRFIGCSASLVRGERNAILSALRMQECAPEIFRLYHSELASIRRHLVKHELSHRFWRAFELADIVLEAFWHDVQTRTRNTREMRKAKSRQAAA